MNKDMQFNLRFMADTSQAQKQIQSLQNSLSKIVNMNTQNKDFQLTQGLKEASDAAAMLQVQIGKAMNVETGNLDLSKLNQSFKESGMSLQKYQQQLHKIGKEGDQAFMQLAKSITTAEIPLKRTSGLLQSFWVSLKNTAKWQISSSIMHGFSGAISKAYGYAQNLNESLNNIRIVTGASVDQMAKFAQEANTAAKALSTTTTEYTNASLIYYQQGLTDQQVKERTDITIKMANVARQSAEVVSDQMTAVWNNFDDGSKSLEYYADVMTALGAATASSTDEIAEGLEKFAAVSKTVGLSYEYATAALATVTATTRQSADVVGTAFKTLFARIQDLELGKTLDDGTTLGKYSEALNAVGINIKDANGEMKLMDDILDEMGSKWGTLSKDQQTALAQTVAGVRQYTQLMALMENWDFMQENLTTVQNADGALENQAEIYAESWEAAQKRVQAAAEELYTKLLDDEFFISFTNGIAEVIDKVGTFVDAMGGVQGVLLGIGNIITLVFKKQIAEGLSNLAFRFKDTFGMTKNLYTDMKNQVSEIMMTSFGDTKTAEVYTEIGYNQQVYIKNAKQMSEEEQAINKLLLERNSTLGMQALKAQEKAEQSEIEQTSAGMELEVVATRKGQEFGLDQTVIDSHIKNLQAHKTAYEKTNKVMTQFVVWNDKLSASVNKGARNFDAAKEEIEEYRQEMARGIKTLAKIEESDSKSLGKEKLAISLGVARRSEKTTRMEYDGGKETKNKVNNLYDALNTPIESVEQLERLKTAFVDVFAIIPEGQNDLTQMTQILQALGFSADEAEASMQPYIQAVQKFGADSAEAQQELEKFRSTIDKHNGSMQKTGKQTIKLSTAMVQAASAMMALGQVWNQVNGIMDVFNDDSATAGDKVMAIVSGIGMLIPAVMGLAPAFSTAKVGAQLFGMEATKAGTAANLAMWQVTLIVAAITAIVAAVAILVTQESAAEKKAKESAKAAEEMKEAADNAAQSLEKINKAFDSYDDAIKKLESCTKGTEEWNVALKEVNSTVLQILQDVPELAKEAGLFVRDLETGMLKIDEAKRENIQQMAQNTADTAAALSVIAQAQVSVDQNELRSDTLSKSTGTRGVGELHTGGEYSYYDDDINLGQILADNAMELANLTEDEYRKKLQKLLIEASNSQAQAYSGFDKQIQSLVDSGVTYQKQVNSLANNTEAASRQMQTAFNMLADIKLGDEYGAAEKTIARKELEKLTKEYKDYYFSLITDAENDISVETAKQKLGYTGPTGISKAADDSNKVYQYIAEQLEYYNTGYSAATGNTVQGADDNRKFIFDYEGKQEEKSAAWVARTLGAARALEELTKSAESAKNTLSDMDADIAKNSKGGQDVQNIAKDVLRGFIANKNFEGHTMGDFDAFYREVAKFNPEGIDTGEASRTDVAWYIDKIYGDGEDGSIRNETAQKYDFDTAEEMIDAFYNGLSGQMQAWETIELPSNLLGTKKLSLETASSLTTAFGKINLGPQGKQAGEKFAEGLNKILEEAKPEDQQAILEKFANIDWSDWNAFDKAKEIMSEFGIEIDTSTDYWVQFINQMRIAGGAMPEFTTLKQNLTEVGEILNDLDFDNVISDEDYEKLMAYNDEWARFFQLQSDGSHAFIGNKQQLKQQTIDNVTAQRQALHQRRTDQQGVKDANWGHYNADGERVAADWATKSGSDVGTARNLMAAKDGGATSNMLNSLGYSDEVIQTLINQAESDDAAIKKEGQDGLREMYRRMDAYLKEDLTTQDKQFDEIMASTAENFLELNELYEQGQIGDSKFGTKEEETAYEKQVKYLTTSQAEAAKNLTELQAVWAEGLATGTELDYSIYADNLQRLGESYSICKEELQSYNLALQSGVDGAIKFAEEALEASIMLGEAAEKYGLDEKELSIQSKQMATAYKLEAKAAAQLAIQNQRMNIGVETLVNNWKDWSKELKKGDKTSRDWAKAATSCTTAIADLVGATVDLELPEDFFDSEENLNLLTQASKGSEEAIAKLGMVIAATQVEMLQLSRTEMPNGDLISLEDFQGWKDTVLSGITSLQENLNNIGVGSNVYEQLGGDNWVAALNQMAIATGMSVDEMNSLLNELGVQAEVEVTSIKQDMEVPTYTEVVEPTNYDLDINGDGEGDGVRGYRRYTIPGEPQKVKGYVQVAQIKTTEGEIDSPKITYTGNGNVSTSAKQGGNGGGSKSPAKAQNKAKKHDMVDRYMEVTDAINNVQDAINDANREADRLWGLDRVEAITKAIKEQAKQLDNLKWKEKEAQEYLIEDKDALVDLANSEMGRKYGLSVQFDKETGDITNKTDMLETLWEAYRPAQHYYAEADNFSTSEEQQEYYDANVKPLEEFFNLFKEAIKQYDDTNQTLEDVENEFEDAVDALSDLNLQEIEAEYSAIEELQDMEMDNIERYISKFEGDPYAAAEVFETKQVRQANVLKQNLDTEAEKQKDLQAKYDAYLAGDVEHGINEAAYIEGMKASRQAMLENIDTLEELQDSMSDYYEETLENASAEIAKYTDRMEALESVLDHMKNITELTRGTQDYETMGAILEGKAEMAKNAFEVSQAEYEMFKKESDFYKQQMEIAQAEGNGAAAKEYEEMWLAAQKKTEEAYDKMLTNTEEWLEAEKALVENKVAKIFQSFENALTDGLSFDYWITQMDRAATLQEEYLTTTNKIYETNKLINKVQQDIDKTSNTAAKRRLNAFQQEVQELQKKGQLSNFELSIEQARYELLLAKIALEEAQNAKSTVRLQRDASGNFGYVYTADQEQVANAEQAVADKENELYNIQLEGANEYARKSIEIQQEFANTMQEIHQKWINGEYESEEEYRAAILAAEEYYYQLREGFAELYGIAITEHTTFYGDMAVGELTSYGTTAKEDSRILADAWSTEFSGMVTNVTTWDREVRGMLDALDVTLSEWKTKEVAITALIGMDDPNNVIQTVKELTNQNYEYKIKITKTEEPKGIISQLETSFKNIKDYLDAADFTNWIKNISKIADDYASAASEAEHLIYAASGFVRNENGTYSKLEQDTPEPEQSIPPEEPTDPSSESAPTKPEFNVSVGDTVKIKEGVTHFSRDGGNGTRMQQWVPDYEGFEVMAQDEDEVLIGVNGGYTGWVWKKDLEGFDTGGYTGEWGQEGRLAVLHEKEIVLNKDDTQKILDAVQIANSMQDVEMRFGEYLWAQSMENAEFLDKFISIEEYNMMKQQDQLQYSLNEVLNTIEKNIRDLTTSLSNAMKEFTNQTQLYSVAPQEKIIEQIVQIEATFPEVTDQNQVVMAFENLVNEASQYAYRR